MECLARVLVFLLLGLATVSEAVKYTEEVELMKAVLEKVDPRIRPIKQYSKPLHVNITGIIQKIERLDEQNEVLYTTLHTLLSWQDEYVQWNVSDTDGIFNTDIPCNNIWTPKLEVTNSITNFEDRPLKIDEQQCQILSNGMVGVPFKNRYETTCSVNVMQFPFDKQTCYIYITSNLLNSRVGLKMSSLLFDNRGVVEINKEWNNVNFQLLSFTTPVNESSLGLYGEVDYIGFVITMERNPTFYVLYLIVPSVLMAVCSALVFLLPADSGERVGLSMTVLLSYTVFLLMVSEVTPRGGDYIAYLLIYITVMEIASAVNLALAVYLLRVHFRDESTPIPRYFRNLLTKTNCTAADTYHVETTTIPNGYDLPKPGNMWPEVAAKLDIIFLVLSVLFIIFATIMLLVAILKSWGEP